MVRVVALLLLFLVIEAGVIAAQKDGMWSPLDDIKTSVRLWEKAGPGVIVVMVRDNTGASHMITGGSSDAFEVTEDTIFEIGSITKVFTTLLTASAIDSPAAKAIKGWDEAIPVMPCPQIDLTNRGLTFQNLAIHKSGLPRLPADFTLAPDYDAVDPYESQHMDQFCASLQEELPKISENVSYPYDYSNFAVALQGLAVAAAWDDKDLDKSMDEAAKFKHLLTHQVLDKLGIGNASATSIAELAEDLKTRIAPTFTAQNESIDDWHWDAYDGAGGILASPAAMLSVIEQFLDKSVPQSWLDTLKTVSTIKPGPGVPDSLATSWLVRQINGQAVAWKDGATFGSSSSIAINLEGKSGVVVLSSRQDPGTSFTSIIALNYMSASRFWPPAQEPEDQLMNIWCIAGFAVAGVMLIVAIVTCMCSRKLRQGWEETSGNLDGSYQPIV